MANQFKRGDSVRFKTVGAGVASSRRGVVVRTVDSGRGKSVRGAEPAGQSGAATRFRVSSEAAGHPAVSFPT